MCEARAEPNSFELCRGDARNRMNSNLTNKNSIIIYLKGLGRDQSRDSKHSKKI